MDICFWAPIQQNEVHAYFYLNSAKYLQRCLDKWGEVKEPMLKYWIGCISTQGLQDDPPLIYVLQPLVLLIGIVCAIWTPACSGWTCLAEGRI